MCKFKDRKEFGYKRVAGALKNLVEDAAGKTEAIIAPQENGMNSKRTIFQSLIVLHELITFANLCSEPYSNSSSPKPGAAHSCASKHQIPIL